MPVSFFILAFYCIKIKILPEVYGTTLTIYNQLHYIKGQCCWKWLNITIYTVFITLHFYIWMFFILMISLFILCKYSSKSIFIILTASYFSGVRITRYLVFSVMFCISLFILFLFTIVLSVLRFTDSDYPFGIFKLFWLYAYHGIKVIPLH